MNIGSSNNQNANFNSWNVDEPPKIEKSNVFLKSFCQIYLFFWKKDHEKYFKENPEVKKKCEEPEKPYIEVKVREQVDEEEDYTDENYKKTNKQPHNNYSQNIQNRPNNKGE